MKKFVRRTPEEKAAIITQVEAARKSGSTFREAVKAAGITDHTFYNWKAKANRSGGKFAKTAVGRQLPQFLQIPLDDESPVIIVMGRAAEVNAALNRLAAMRGTA